MASSKTSKVRSTAFLALLSSAALLVPQVHAEAPAKLRTPSGKVRNSGTVRTHKLTVVGERTVIGKNGSPTKHRSVKSVFRRYGAANGEYVQAGSGYARPESVELSTEVEVDLVGESAHKRGQRIQAKAKLASRSTASLKREARIQSAVDFMLRPIRASSLGTKLVVGVMTYVSGLGMQKIIAQGDFASAAAFTGIAIAMYLGAAASIDDQSASAQREELRSRGEASEDDISLVRRQAGFQRGTFGNGWKQIAAESDRKDLKRYKSKKERLTAARKNGSSSPLARKVVADKLQAIAVARDNAWERQEAQREFFKRFDWSSSNSSTDVSSTNKNTSPSPASSQGPSRQQKWESIGREARTAGIVSLGLMALGELVTSGK